MGYYFLPSNMFWHSTTHLKMSWDLSQLFYASTSKLRMTMYKVLVGQPYSICFILLLS